MSGAALDWTKVHPDKKWMILQKQTRFALWALYTSVGCIMMGFDFGVAGTVTAFPAFQQKMGKVWPSQPSGYLIPANVQSGWSGASVAGDLVGVFISGQLMDWVGRKWTIMGGIIFTAIGIGIQIASQNWQVFLVGRLINAIGFGMVFILSPVWIGETVRPELRGTFLCLQNCAIVFGQFILALVAYGTQTIEGKWSYQSLIVLQFAFVVPLLLGWPFFPESPYYHLKKNNEDGARKSFRKIYGSRDQALIDAEVARLKDVIATDDELAAIAGADGRPLLQVWKGKDRKRTLTACLAASSQQFIGAAFVLGYITYFLSLLGIQNFFQVNVALFCIMLASNVSAFPLVEIIGRRPLLLYGMIALTLIELLMGIMGVIVNAAALWVILVCIFLWAIVYQVSIGAVGYALAAELPSPPLRSTTISVATIVNGFVGWLIGFVSPYMINPDAGNLGGKVGFVFFGFGLPLSVLFFFYIPETKGMSFEEIDTMFQDNVNPRYFKREVALRRQVMLENEEHDGPDVKEPVATTVETERV